MSAIFQRPLCDMGAAYDYAFRPNAGEPDAGSGGPCDDRPHRVEVYAASSAGSPASSDWREFALCPEHEAQLRRIDERLAAGGRGRRFRGPVNRPGAADAAETR